MIMPRWVGRAAALALLAASLAAIYLLGVAPLADRFRDTSRAIVDTRDLLARFDRQVSARAGLESQVAELQTRLARQGQYLNGGTYDLAAASLQDGVKAIVEAHGGAVQSLQTMPSAAGEDGRRVAIRMQSTMAADPLLQTIHRLESGTPYLFLDNLEIQGRLSRQGRLRQNDEDPVLLVWFDLYGYLPPVVE